MLAGRTLGSKDESSDSCTTGTLASGYMSIKGMNVPWSHPRCPSFLHGIPATCVAAASMVRMLP